MVGKFESKGYLKIFYVFRLNVTNFYIIINIEFELVVTSALIVTSNIINRVLQARII